MPNFPFLPVFVFFPPLVAFPYPLAGSFLIFFYLDPLYLVVSPPYGSYYLENIDAFLCSCLYRRVSLKHFFLYFLSFIFVCIPLVSDWMPFFIVLSPVLTYAGKKKKSLTVKWIVVLIGSSKTPDHFSSSSLYLEQRDRFVLFITV